MSKIVSLGIHFIRWNGLSMTLTREMRGSDSLGKGSRDFQMGKYKKVLYRGFTIIRVGDNMNFIIGFFNFIGFKIFLNFSEFSYIMIITTV